MARRIFRDHAAVCSRSRRFGFKVGGVRRMKRVRTGWHSY
jgi:hypothetical protein